jgi:hypothetical protein
MARGWESKAVADQIEEGNSIRQEESARVRRSTEERAQLQRIQSLQLSKARLLDQLERATHPAYRQTLLSGLQAVESEIEELSNALDSMKRLK